MSTDRELAVAMRVDGLGMLEIARRLGRSQSWVWHQVHNISIRRVCLIPECLVEFETRDPRKRYCCRNHAKLGITRNAKGLTPVEVECSLPECSVLVWSFVGHRRYCSLTCASRDARREASGFYDRLFGDGPRCQVCGETSIVDEHHTLLVHGKMAKRASAIANKSIKSGPSIFLCPTHHMMVHRGLARLENGLFIDLRSLIMAKYLEKKGLRPVGRRLKVLRPMSNHLDHLLGFLYGFRETIYETNRLTSEVRHLEGDIVECGIACGAQLAAMKLAAPEKLAWGYDSFEGIELAGKEDEFQPGIGRVDPNRNIPENRLVSSGITSHSLESVLENLNRWHLNPSGFRFVKGWVQHTMVDPQNLPEKICVLRLDMDMHDATKTALEHLFPRLVKGGVLIIDDWEYAGVHTALRNYFETVGYVPDWKNPLHAGYLYK